MLNDPHYTALLCVLSEDPQVPSALLVRFFVTYHAHALVPYNTKH